MIKKILVIVISSVLLFSSGCSVFMAAKQPDKKNVELFKLGTPRSMLLGEFGPPVHSELRNSKKFEIFKFVQGYSTGAKAGRALTPLYFALPDSAPLKLPGSRPSPG